MGRLTKSRMIAFFVLVAAVLTSRPVEREPVVEPSVSGSPTAVEEAGESEIADNSQQSSPPQLSRRQRRRTPRVRAPTISSSPGQLPVERPSDATRPGPGFSSVASPDHPDERAPISARPKASVQVEPEAPATAEQSPALAVTAPPRMSPPILLSGPSGFPADAYRIVLEGGGLSPQIRVTALEGRVVLRIFVQSSGIVGRVEVAESSGYEVLDNAAISAAWSWRFAPATRDGMPIDAWALVPVRFVVREP